MKSIEIVRIRIVIFLFFSLSLFTLSAESSIERYFLSMPDEYYLTLTKEMRKELIDAYKVDSSLSVKNKFRGESYILELDTTQNRLLIQNSLSGIVEVKMITNEENLSCLVLIFTACAPVCNSHIGFYNLGWQMMKSSLLPPISITDFLDKEKIEARGESLQDISKQFDVFFTKYTFERNSNNIEIVLNSSQFMEAENYERLKPYLKGNKLTFSLKNQKYEKASLLWED